MLYLASYQILHRRLQANIHQDIKIVTLPILAHHQLQKLFCTALVIVLHQLEKFTE
jgi:hypothetical protein